MNALSANGHSQCDLLVVDFDDTLTAGDTISVIFDAAAAAAEASAGALLQRRAAWHLAGLTA